MECEELLAEFLNTMYQVETRLPLKGLVIMPVNSEKASNGKTIRRSHYVLARSVACRM